MKKNSFDWTTFFLHFFQSSSILYTNMQTKFHEIMLDTMALPWLKPSSHLPRFAIRGESAVTSQRRRSRIGDVVVDRHRSSSIPIILNTFKTIGFLEKASYGILNIRVPNRNVILYNRTPIVEGRDSFSIPMTLWYSAIDKECATVYTIYYDCYTTS